MRRYRTRGGSVKVNLVLSEPPRYDGLTDEEQRLIRTAGVNICPSIDYLERAWQDATRGVPAEGPYIEVEVPSEGTPSISLTYQACDETRCLAPVTTEVALR